MQVLIFLMCIVAMQRIRKWSDWKIEQLVETCGKQHKSTSPTELCDVVRLQIVCMKGELTSYYLAIGKHIATLNCSTMSIIATVRLLLGDPPIQCRIALILFASFFSLCERERHTNMVRILIPSERCLTLMNCMRIWTMKACYVASRKRRKDIRNFSQRISKSLRGKQ